MVIFIGFKLYQWNKKQLIDFVSNPKEKENLTTLTKLLISELLSL
jgi:hypothetical protein